MQTKTIMVLDDATEMPVVALRNAGTLAATESPIFDRAGYRGFYVWMHPLHGSEMRSDPRSWGNRTRVAAHLILLRHWSKIKNGESLDVRAYPDELSEALRMFGGHERIDARASR